MEHLSVNKKSIVIAIMIAMFLGAVEGTIVTTAVPTITKSLNGFELISWVFSAYLLTTAVSTPIYGKLSDLYGRKRMYFVGILTFLIGSSLCGLSRNMIQLIGFRALQGIGAGAIVTVGYTIIGDVFPPSERARIQGWLSSVWGVASLIGPFAGGFIIDTLSWHWIFFINIPFGILSIIILETGLKENFKRKKHNIDYAGTFVISAAILSFLSGLMAGGKSGKFFAQLPVILIGASAIFIVIFYYIEKKAEEPIFPFEIFKKSTAVANAICFVASGIIIGADVYLPVYIQNVLGYRPAISGLSLAPMSVSWMMSAIILSKAIPKYGERTITAVSALILLTGSVFLSSLEVDSSLIEIIFVVFFMGFGFGGIFTTLTIAVQSSVDFGKRGAATASNTLLSAVGQTIGVSVFGNLLNMGIVKYFGNRGIIGVDPDNLYSGQKISDAFSAEQVHEAVNSGLHEVFVMFVVFSIVCGILSVFLSSELKEAKKR